LDKREEQREGVEPEAAKGELGRRCGLCRADLAGELYLLRGLVICPSCARGIAQRQTGAGKLRRALLFGTVAAISTALVWYLLARASSRPLAGLAVAAGVLVGLAVHQGSGGRGGWRYQIAAALLVYGAFVGRYVPPVFGGIADAIRKEHGAQLAARAPATAVPAAATGPPATILPPSPPPASLRATLKAYLVFTVIAWGLVLASPFLPGTASVLALLALAAGMAIAVRLNRQVRLQGPFTEEK
jgi:hypothetical protein